MGFSSESVFSFLFLKTGLHPQKQVYSIYLKVVNVFIRTVVTLNKCMREEEGQIFTTDNFGIGL